MEKVSKAPNEPETQTVKVEQEKCPKVNIITVSVGSVVDEHQGDKQSETIKSESDVSTTSMAPSRDNIGIDSSSSCMLNAASTVDTTDLHPSPYFEKPLTDSPHLAHESGNSSASEMLLRRDSNEMYKQELENWAKMTRISPIVGDKQTKMDSGTSAKPVSVVMQTNEERNVEFSLVVESATTDQSIATNYIAPHQWIATLPPEKVEPNLRNILNRKDGLVHIVDEGKLPSTEYELERNRRLFANKRNIFYIGRYKGKSVLVKKCLDLKSYQNSNDPGPIWISVAKMITKPQSDETVRNPFAQIYDIFYLDSDQTALMFIELISNKSLHYRVKRRIPIHINQARNWASQVLDGITVLANYGVAHRSIRLEHLILDGNGCVRIISWRRSIPLIGVITRRERRIRSNNHLPPECFRGCYDASTVDLFSWGVMLCALCTFRYPFNVKYQRVVEDEWTNFKSRHTRSCNPLITAILDSIFFNDPDKRATMIQVQQSEFFTLKPIVPNTTSPVVPSSQIETQPSLERTLSVNKRVKQNPL